MIRRMEVTVTYEDLGSPKGPGTVRYRGWPLTIDPDQFAKWKEEEFRPILIQEISGVAAPREWHILDF